MPTTASPHRATRPRDQRGQGTLEYVGIVVVAAILVAAVVLTDSGAQVRTAIGCQIRSIVTQSGSCGSGEGGDTPTTYDASGANGSHGPGVSGTPPTADGPPGTVEPGEGGGHGTPSGWDNAESTPVEPVDQDVVDEAHDTFEDKLDGGWNGVRSGELSEISDMLEDLSGPELDALVASMSDDQLRHWVDELDDGMLGSGWSRERRRELWNMIAAKATAATMRRLDEFTDEVQPEFDTVGGDDARDDPDSPVHDATYTQVPHELFAGDPEDPDEPLVDPTDLDQGMIGDCWLIASIGAIANSDPELIEQMIRANDNGTYTVTLYDDGDAVDVTVTPDIPTVDGDPLFADNPSTSDAGEGTYELWPQLLEKAVAQYYGDYEDLEGDWPSKALELLSGRDAHTYEDDWFGLDDVDPPSVGDIDTLLDGGGAMLVSTAHDNRTPLYDDGTIVQGHAYYVQQVDPDKGTVTIVNPWGLDSYPPITMTYDEFEASFIRYDTVDLG
jgi:Calpain family cysteine protease